MVEIKSSILIRILHKPISLPSHNPQQTEAQGTTNNFGQVHFIVTLLVQDTFAKGITF
jgi:hypothetical protein